MNRYTFSVFNTKGGKSKLAVTSSEKSSCMSMVYQSIVAENKRAGVIALGSCLFDGGRS